jgi:O-antigen ligase
LSQAGTAPYDPQGGWFASVLFVLVFLYFWVGMDPLPRPATFAELTAYGNSSNTFNQLIVLAMTMLVVTMLFLHPGRELALRAFGPVLMVFAWIALTIFFADNPETALRRTIYSALVVLCGSAVLLLPRDTSQFAKLVGFCLFIVVGLSYFGVVFMPGRAIHQASDVSEAALAGNWRGIYSHKNLTSAAMGLAVFFGLYLMRAHAFWMGLILTLLAAFFLLNTGGKTSAAMLPAMLVLAWLFERAGPMRLVLVGGGLFALNAFVLSVVSVPGVRSFVSSLGIDASFTDRASIWQLALGAIGNRPLTGYGFQSFWQTDALFFGNQSAATWAVTAANAHNAYLEQMINGGALLLVLVVIWLVVLPCRNASMALQRGADPDLTRLYIRVWLYILFSSTFESPFFDNDGPIWFTMLIAIFGLRLQARALLVEKPRAGSTYFSPAPS